MGARDKVSWWLLPGSFAVLNGLVLGTTILIFIKVTPPVSNTMRAAPSAPEFAFARWTTCDAASAELTTQAMRVPRGVLVRTADARGADTVLVPIRSYREAEGFLAELGCPLPGPTSADKEPTWC